MFRQSTRFDVFLQDSNQDESVRQRVDPGDATNQIASTQHRQLAGLSDLLTNISLSSKAITPNGDGVNDELTMEIALVNVLTPRPLRLRLYDLAGRRCTTTAKTAMPASASSFGMGRDSRGDRVAPGLYVLEILVEGDAGDEKVQALISVAY